MESRSNVVMKAIVYHRSSVEKLKLEEIEKPIPGDDEILIKVRAAAVNPLDYHFSQHPFLRRLMSLMVKGKFSRPGRDVAGEVESVGRNVTQFKPGDEVFGACNGAFAEYACALEKGLVKKPPNISFEQAASITIAGLTALQGLRKGLSDNAQLRPDQKVLINGAAGGVGTYAVQIAKVFGAQVTAVCSTRNMDMVQSIGADQVVDYTRADFTSNGQKYDLLFDLVANHSFSEHTRALTPKGTYIGAGVLGLHGSFIKLINVRLTEFVRSPFATQQFMSLMAKMNKRDLDTIASLIAEGRIRPVIESRYNLSEVPEAVRFLGEAHARGKVIINFDELN